jgi:hypothetical protein
MLQQVFDRTHIHLGSQQLRFGGANSFDVIERCVKEGVQSSVKIESPAKLAGLSQLYLI